ncbi:hypothetical protein [Anaerosacchariphilus polymeriproducens]|uniref:ABC-2 family transporter protein n=1 Tax=Anaerosacchariphilus polymeriproducens TaxID=1812858 RepID=A0A371AV41_9FIRM|nr:hypothetical protein [Anaerosacchariphilus polymeriproducens]RDU23437.1 hypothetical protein DWV06_09525 [Anaerosacchariphilus polymeriproducens]
MSRDGNLLSSYLRMDFNRSIFSCKFVIGIFGVVGVMFFAIFDDIELNNNIVYVCTLVLQGVPVLVSYIFCAFTYASCFCEDSENNYFNLEVIRGKLSFYTCSKVIVIFLTAMITMILGLLIFITILHTFLPWITEENSVSQTLLTTGGFHRILQNGDFYLYYFLSGIQQGILAGILALFGSYLSLFIRNKLLIWSVPVIGYYFFDILLIEIFGEQSIGLVDIFNSVIRLCSDDLISYLFSVGIGICFVVVFYVLIYTRLKGKIQFE